MAAELTGDSAKESSMGAHLVREAHKFSLGDDQAFPGGPTKRVRKLIEYAGAPAEIREFTDSGRRLNILRQTDLSWLCVSSSLECWGSSSTPTCFRDSPDGARRSQMELLLSRGEDLTLVSRTPREGASAK